MSRTPAVMVGCDDLVLLDEVIRHLEEIPHWRLLSSARSASEIVRRRDEADVLLVSDGLAIELAPGAARGKPARAVVFGRRETTAALRAALDLGALGFLTWPEQRAQLRSMVEQSSADPAPSAGPAGALHVVWAPKGGSGASVVAAHLAGAFARAGEKALLVDMDLDNSDQTSLMGADAEHKTVGNLLRVADELTPATVRSILWSHPLGFEVALGPGEVGSVSGADAGAAARVLAGLQEAAEHLVVDAPSGHNPVLLAALGVAHSVQVVLTPDLMGLRRTRDLLHLVGDAIRPGAGVNVVLNQAGGPDVSTKQVSAVLGVEQVFRVKASFSIYRAANRGELSPAACRMLAPLARRLCERSAGPRSPERGKGIKAERSAGSPEKVDPLAVPGEQVLVGAGQGRGSSSSGSAPSPRGPDARGASSRSVPPGRRNPMAGQQPGTDAPGAG